MAKPNNSKTKWIWLSVLILFVCVAATTIAFMSRLDSFLLDDEGAISLITEDTSETDDSSDETDGTQSQDSAATQDSETEQDSTSSTDTPGTDEPDPSTSTTPEVTQPPKNPGFEAGDDKTVWGTNTQVEIFSVSYVNGEQIITVKSDNGDKVIAPGTENSYTFKLKNTGNVALDYTVEIDAYFTPADITIPITGRLNRYDGKWVVGGKDEYANVPVLDTATDSATLGAGKYTYYTLDWLWPFESGDDELDTLLGNLATEQELTFTIVIKTTATESSNPYDDSGITLPQTGDNSNLTLWIVLAVSSFMMMLFLIFCQNKEKRRLLCGGR
jgi:LPXTG-motif cell wall-anchored protein